MQSHNYVLGVSGWKMHSNGTLEVNGKIRAIMVEQVDKPETPFAVQGDQVFLRETFIDAAAFEPAWGVRTSTSADGRYVAAGIGLGCMCEGGYTGKRSQKEDKVEVRIDFSDDVSKGLDQLSTALGETRLGESLTAKIDHIQAFADTQEKVAVTIGGVQYINRSLIKGKAARLVADEIIAASTAAKQ